MPTTTNGLPYPQLGDGNNPPADLQALAEAVDDLIVDSNPFGAGKTAQFGSFVTTVTSTTVTETVTFTTAFAAAPEVFCTIIDTAETSSGARVDKWGTSGGDTSGFGSTTGFVFKSQRNSGSAPIRVNWIAVG